ncbi:HAD-IB family phosphatase [Roseibacillus persicicus]|uniref:HAD-IB family phosphatase n=1 Tax=Roseibacillus persicicus TaxID=454148 RepID=UPI00280E4BA4|nr:HAD-IB family phosphatase [Roseibacillus persicicus]MDQ8188809.1 HAD-IB family phosphatase [Roseibacillus persicicus]
MNKLLFLDCDSTLCAIEGVDELAALRGPQAENEVIKLTNQAMDGTVPIDEVFGRRLDLILPSREMCKQVGELYIKRLSPGVVNALTLLRERGWEPIIISGGFTPVIEPVADLLNITKIYAVDLYFNEDGSYRGFNAEAPTARNGGKPDIIRDLVSDITPSQTVMLGDGISDLETNSVVDLFIGYGGVISREAVKKQATAFIKSFDELPSTIENYLSETPSSCE